MTPDELLESAQKLRDAWNNLIARHHVDVPAILAGAVALEACAERLAAAEADTDELRATLDPLVTQLRNLHDYHAWDDDEPTTYRLAADAIEDLQERLVVQAAAFDKDTRQVERLTWPPSCAECGEAPGIRMATVPLYRHRAAFPFCEPCLAARPEYRLVDYSILDDGRVTYPLPSVFDEETFNG